MSIRNMTFLKVLPLALISATGAQIAKLSALHFTPDETSAIMVTVIVIAIIIGSEILNYEEE